MECGNKTTVSFFTHSLLLKGYGEWPHKDSNHSLNPLRGFCQGPSISRGHIPVVVKFPALPSIMMGLCLHRPGILFLKPGSQQCWPKSLADLCHWVYWLCSYCSSLHPGHCDLNSTRHLLSPSKAWHSLAEFNRWTREHTGQAKKGEESVECLWCYSGLWHGFALLKWKLGTTVQPKSIFRCVLKWLTKVHSWSPYQRTNPQICFVHNKLSCPYEPYCFFF